MCVRACSLAEQFSKFVKDQDKKLQLQERLVLGKISTALRLRVQAMQSIGIEATIQLEHIKLLPKLISSLSQEGRQEAFPVELEQFMASGAQLVAGKSPSVKEFDVEGNQDSGPPPKPFTGTRIKLDIEKIGIKDAEDTSTYINSHFLVFVVDKKGNITEPEKTTNFATSRVDRHILFEAAGSSVELEQSLEVLEQVPGAAIFFLFNHFKNKGGPDGDGYVSTKCYSFMELDELKDAAQKGQTVQLETLKCAKSYHLHEKALMHITKTTDSPTVIDCDFARTQQPSRLSVKPLYLHVKCHLSAGGT